MDLQVFPKSRLVDMEGKDLDEEEARSHLGGSVTPTESSILF